MEHLLKVYKM